MIRIRQLSSLPIVASFVAISFFACPAGGDDWPTYRHDQQRSGKSSESLDVARLDASWTWRSSLAPTPAWPDSARWDAYAKLDGLRSMRNYDPVFHPVIVDGRLYLPSNVDDSVRCFDLESGELLWIYTASAPVRIAPTIYEGQALFASDDGYVYSVDAQTGELTWCTEAATSLETFVNDGRIVSFMPIRTGVLIDPIESRAIVAAGMFPWRSTALCGLDLSTGELAFQRDLGTGWTIEGALLLSPEHLIAAQGRAAPQLFDRETGEPQGALPGGGGSFVILTDDDQILHGPGNKGGWITASRADSREKIASFDRGTAVIVDDDTAFLLDVSKLSALDRESGAVKWSVTCHCPHELIMAGETLFAGGDDRVLAFDAQTGRLQWMGEVHGRVFGIAVANQRLVVSTDTGQVSVFAPTGSAVEPPLLELDTIDITLPTELPPTPSVDESEDLLERWVFHSNQLQLESQADPTATPALANQQISTLTNNGRPLTLPHGSRIVQAGVEHAWLLDGSVDAEVAASFRDVPHPNRELTVTAWIRLDKPQSWGGLLSISQDNGSYEKGWLLGFRDDRFGFCLNGTEGPDRLTWLTNPQQPFEPTRWYHVAATYDGQTMRLYVDGAQVAETDEQRGDVAYPENAAFHLGSYKDDDEHFYTHGMLNEIRLYQRALSADEIVDQASEKQGRFPEVLPVEAIVDNSLPPSRGPLLRFTAPGEASIRWWTDTPQPSTLEVLSGDEVVETLGSAQPKTDHQVVLTGLRRDQVKKYRIVHIHDGERRTSAEYECDRHFDYLRPTLPESELDDKTIVRAQRLLTNCRNLPARGMAVVIGSADEGRLAEAISRLAQLDVIVLEPSPVLAAATRQRLIDAGVYGRTISVPILSGLDDVRLPKQFADLVIASSKEMDARSDEATIQRCLRWVRPQGSVVFPVGSLSLEQRVERSSPRQFVQDEELGLEFIQTPRLAGAAPWTHMYGLPDNSAYAGETLSGARSQQELRVQWAGRPGPRYQSDRGNRKPSPLAAGGRLYMQGLHRLIALNAHNGSILWSMECPEVVRFNVPRDSSNWCADEHSVYVTANNRCLVINGASGDIEAEYDAYPINDRATAWGYVARHGELLLGSSVDAQASFREFWGGEHWYDAIDGEHAKKVCSDIFFAREADSGAQRWTYDDGLIINPTITIAEGRVHFLVCRSESLRDGQERRLAGDVFWANLHLVTLDLETGETIWDIPAKPLAGVSAMYLVAAEGKLVLQTSNDGVFAVYTFAADSGEAIWRGRYEWETNHHGKHLSRPAIVGGKIYLRPLTLSLEDGSVLAEAFPAGHQCGTYTASRDALFLRAGSLAMWDRTTGDSTRWSRARPDCWISTIPAEGLLLSPEGGGGCSCGGWIETSMGFIPVEQAR